MSMMDEIKRADKASSQWLPKPGECIAGVVVGFREFVTKFGKGRSADIRCEEDGVVRSVLLRAVLKSEFEKQGIEVGDEVGIKYVGKAEGKIYHDFIVITHKIRHLSEPEKEAEDETDIPWPDEEKGG